MERIVLAFSKDTAAGKIKNMLHGTGYEVISVCHSKAELIRYISELDDILVIMGYKLPDATADEVYEDMSAEQKLISIVKADYADNVTNPEIRIVTLPVTRQHLISAVDILTGIIEKRHTAAGRHSDDEDIIKRAKLFLMETYMMTEDEAHRFIQRRSMNTGSKFIDTAKKILHI